MNVIPNNIIDILVLDLLTLKDAFRFAMVLGPDYLTDFNNKFKEDINRKIAEYDFYEMKREQQEEYDFFCKE